MAILKYLIKRVVAMIIMISAVIAIGYVMMYYTPGGFFTASNIASALGPLAAQNPQLYQQILRDFQERYGLNYPLWHQILLYIWHSLTFNFGYSMQNPSIKIMTTLHTAFPISCMLAFGSIVLALIVGIPLGIIAAIKRNTWVDYTASTVAISGQAIPAFVTAALLVLLFGVVIQGVLPVNGWGGPGHQILPTPGQAVLPIVSLGLGTIGVVAKYVRNSLVDIMRQDHIRTAQAKGVRYWRIVMKHGVRNSLTAMITVIGPAFAFTIVGTIWVEQIFSIPGLGQVLSTAFTNDDFPLAITSIFILAALISIMNLLVDISYSLMDPRVKLE